ncbi:MAG: hypothetical protein J2P16_04820, partial [Mycobacterium sp.]|nr:hypothetical protein [Mycobacterium sp.]
NTTNIPLPAVRYQLSVPDGWQVSPIGPQPSLIAAHQEAQVRWRVTVPVGAPASNPALGMQIGYSTDAGTATVTSAPAVATTSPPITISAFRVSPNTVQPGQPATLNVTVRNVSPEELSGNLNVSGPDNWPITPANNSFDLASGASQSFTATAINPGTWTSQPVTLTASATYSGGVSGGQATAELFAGNVRCLLGKSDQPIWHADPGYGCTLDSGITYYDPTHAVWSPTAPANYCWCQNPGAPLLFHVAVPAGVSGTLGLLIVDGDNFQGGRSESISVEGRDLGTFSNFQQGKWVTADVSAADTADGKIAVRVDDAREGSNVVVSQATFATTTAPTPATPIAAAFGVTPNTAQPGQQATFRMTVVNAGSNPQTGQVSITGPDGWSITPAAQNYSLAAGASQTFTATTTNPGTSTSMPLTFTANTTYTGGSVRDQAELFAGHLRCLLGNTDEPIWHADPGYGCTLDQGYQFYDPNHASWPTTAPANYCWCQPQPGAPPSPLLFHLTVPAGTSGTLRLLLVDGDNFQGGRVESVSVEGHNIGTFSNFQQGIWVSADISAADTADGRIDVRIDNAQQGSNVVASQASF